MTREFHHPRSESTDLEAAAVLLIRRSYGEVVRMVGHSHPIAVRLWELISAEAGRPGSTTSQHVGSGAGAALFGGEV